MIHRIINQIKDRVLNLKYIERYGGIVIPVEDYLNAGDEEFVKTKKVVFPASCDVEGKACLDAGDYFELAPNDRYRSVAYWELRGDAVPFTVKMGNRGAYRGLKQQVRFVAWLNLLLLGHNGKCGDLSGQLAALTLKTLEGEHTIDTPSVKKVKLKLNRQVQKSMDIFGRYSYSDQAALILYPFDFFALDWEVEWIINKNCIPEEMDYHKIDCINR